MFLGELGEPAANYNKNEGVESLGNEDLLVAVKQEVPDPEDDNAEFEVVWGDVGIDLEAAGTSCGSKDEGASSPFPMRAEGDVLLSRSMLPMAYVPIKVEEDVLPSKRQVPMTFIPIKVEEDMLHSKDKVPMTRLPVKVEHAPLPKSVASTEGIPIKVELASPSKDEAEALSPQERDAAAFELVWGDVRVGPGAQEASESSEEEEEEGEADVTYFASKVEATLDESGDEVFAFPEESKDASEKDEAGDDYSSPPDEDPVENTEPAMSKDEELYEALPSNSFERFSSIRFERFPSNSFERFNANNFGQFNARLECESSEELDSLEERAQEGRERPHKCDVCSKRYVLRQGLTRHMRLHSKEKSHICEVCDKAFPDRSALMTHMRSHTKEKPFTCETCNKSFSVKSTLMTHRVIHTNERPFKCGTCGKAFIWKAGLDRHMNIHTKEKRFACDTCHKAFNDKSTLVTHLRIHTNVRPFECHICCKAFARRRHLVRHLNVHARRDEGVPKKAGLLSESGLLGESNSIAVIKKHGDEEDQLPLQLKEGPLQLSDSTIAVMF